MAWAKWSDTLRRCLMARAIKAESIWSELFGHTFMVQDYGAIGLKAEYEPNWPQSYLDIAP